MRAALLALALLVAPPALAQQKAGAPEAVGEAAGLVVAGIEVDESAKTDIEARLAGWRAAQRLAWPQLWARLSGGDPRQAPRLADSALDQMVSAIEVERESVGRGRYVARLAVVFDRTRAAAFLGRFAPLVQSPPMLVLPVLQDAATRMAYEPANPWVAAWLRFRAGESAVDYVRLRASPADTLLLSAFQAERPDIGLWRLLMDRYQTADVLIPELILERSYVGGPARALLIARFGPAARTLARVELRGDDGNIDALLDRAVAEADRLYTAALRSGQLVPDELLAPPEEPVEVPEIGETIGARAVEAAFRVQVDTPDNATLEAIERRLRAAPGIAAVRLESFVIGGRSILAVATDLQGQELAFALDQVALRLENGVLRERRPDEAPFAPPVPEVPPAAGAEPPAEPAGD